MDYDRPWPLSHPTAWEQSTFVLSPSHGQVDLRNFLITMQHISALTHGPMKGLTADNLTQVFRKISWGQTNSEGASSQAVPSLD